MQMVNKDLARVEQVSIALLRKLENQAMDLNVPSLTVKESTYDLMSVISLQSYILCSTTQDNTTRHRGAMGLHV